MGTKSIQSLGNNEQDWKEYDATELLSHAFERLPLLIDQGVDDEFLHEHLSTDIFAQACKSQQHPANIRMQIGYDHSYFFIASFIDEHIDHHAKALNLIP